MVTSDWLQAARRSGEGREPDPARRHPYNQPAPPLHSSPKGTPSADDLRGWATPVATDPRRPRDERPHRRTWSIPPPVFAAVVAPPGRGGVRHAGVRGRAQGGPAAEIVGAARRAGVPVRLSSRRRSTVAPPSTDIPLRGQRALCSE